MKDLIVSFIMANIHSFDICSIETDLGFFYNRSFSIFASDMFKDSKGIAITVLANIFILIPCTNYALRYQSILQLNPCQFSI